MEEAGSSPLISIITIALNSEKHIEKTIRSVLDQTYKNIEYIIIDGGSQDQTVSLIKKYQHRLACWCSEKDKGISDAFNKGIKRATGDIIGLINADDWYEKDTVETVVERMGHYDIIYGDLTYWLHEKKVYVQKANIDLLDYEMSINHPTVFIKRSCYERHGFFDETLKCAMDYELVLRLKLNGCRFRYIPMIIANMRLEGLSDKLWLLGCRETLAIKNRYFQKRSSANKLYFYKQAAAISIARFLKKAGLGNVVKFYRTRFSLIKKQYG